jgi:hypothetical protein
MNKITFEEVPEAISFLIQELSTIRHLIENERIPINKRVLIDIDQASKVILKAKPTIYSLVKKGVLKSYKRGKKLYFFEDELISFITEGKKKTIEEIKSDLDSEMGNEIRRISKFRKL